VRAVAVGQRQDAQVQHGVDLALAARTVRW
jgi:hypothetical protein